jgi:opacity protein-like surface antigen
MIAKPPDHRGAGPIPLMTAAFLLVLAPVRAGAAEGPSVQGSGTVEAGVVQVYTEPEGATVYVDNVPAHDKTPVEVSLGPGVHELRIEMDGYQTETRSVEVAAGEKKRIALMLLPTPRHAAEDRRNSFEGGYINAGAVLTRILTSDVTLGSTVAPVAANFRDQFKTATGLAISLRYVQPLQDKAFLIVDTSYLDARLYASDVKFPPPVNNIDKVSLLLFRGSLEFSVGPNWIDYLLPYAGGGFSYTVIEDTDRVGWLGGDNQVQFTGYSLKAGLLWNSRHHLVVDLQGQYHWAYDLEDYMLVMTVGYKL